MSSTGLVVLLALAGVVAAVAFNWYKASDWQTAVRELKALKAAVRSVPSTGAQMLVWDLVHPDEPYPKDSEIPAGTPDPRLAVWQVLHAARQLDIPDSLLKET